MFHWMSRGNQHHAITQLLDNPTWMTNNLYWQLQWRHLHLHFLVTKILDYPHYVFRLPSLRNLEYADFRKLWYVNTLSRFMNILSRTQWLRWQERHNCTQMTSNLDIIRIMWTRIQITTLLKFLVNICQGKTQNYSECKPTPYRPLLSICWWSLSFCRWRSFLSLFNHEVCRHLWKQLCESAARRCSHHLLCDWVGGALSGTWQALLTENYGMIMTCIEVSWSPSSHPYRHIIHV